MMRILQAYTVHGVADRITLALWGWKLAQATGRAFQYIWRPHARCNCAFERVFSTARFPVLGEFAVSPVLCIRFATFSELARNIPWMSASPICLDHTFGHNYDDFERVFSPAEEVAVAVRRYQEEALEGSSRVLGVHVRRGDKKQYTLSTDADYFGVIDGLLDGEPEAKVFLATDEVAVEESFRRQYGKRVKTYPVRSYERSSPEGVVDAVIVLYLLRGASRVVAGMYSGYSLLAAWNRPFVKVATAETPLLRDWEGRTIEWPGAAGEK